MRVLVAVASRHGSTWEMGEAVAAVLGRAGLAVDLVDPDDVERVDGYDAVVLGSSVYVGRWAASARALVDRVVDGLVRVPVWLFSSGPVGFPPVPADEPAEVPGLVARIGAREHRTFPGRLDLSRLGLAERAVVALLRAEEGDFRPWDEVEAWAAQVAAQIQAEGAGRLRLVR